MRAGALRHRITIQARSTARDSFGADTDVWTGVVTLWGQVEDIRGVEFVSAAQYEAQVTTRIYVRYYPDPAALPSMQPGITAAMRAVADGRTWDIQAVQDLTGRHREMILLCLERIGQ